MILAFAHLSLLLAWIALAVSCPPENAIKPCKCEYGRLYCANLVSVNDLIRVFKNSKGQIEEVRMVSAVLPYIPREIFNGVQLNYFFVENSTVTKLFDFPPDNQKDLKYLHVISSKVSNKNWNLFRLSGLKTLVVAYTNLRTLDKNFVDNLPKGLTQMTFSNTHPLIIKPGTFNELKDLASLKFDACGLRTLRRDIFPTPFGVKYLSFRENKLTLIPDGFFAQMPNLKSVWLQGNNLFRISEAVFGGHASRLESLRLDDNPIRCDCGVSWLVKNGPVETDGTCVSPVNLKGKDLTDLTSKDFKC